MSLTYQFTPASLLSNFAPLLVVFHAEQEFDGVIFEYKMWNILTISTYFLKQDCPSIKEPLEKLIRDISYENDCEDFLYFYGHNKGASQALLYGKLIETNDVYGDTDSLSQVQRTQRLQKVLDRFEKE